MPLNVMKKNRVQATVRGQADSLTVEDLEPGTIFKLFPAPPGGDETLGFSASGRIFVKSGNGRGPTGQLLKDRYNGDQAPLAIVIPDGPDDDRAWTPATHRLTAETPVMQVLGILEIDIF